MMQRVCAWCGSDLGLCAGPDGEVSHGICAVCLDRVNCKRRSFNWPVLVFWGLYLVTFAVCVLFLVEVL